MQVLAFDHFFKQDLDALREGLDTSDHLEVLPYQRLYYLARRTFPLTAFNGVRAAYSPRYASNWIRYRRKAVRFADWLRSAHHPDVFVVPSDAFFYLRPVIERFAETGLRTVVVQKETTISPLVMDEHSREVGQFVPFMSTVMTVCSERHRQFWLAAGTDPERVVVTGQPRFDVYADRQPTGGVPDHPSILFLSYDDAAYLPSDLGQAFEGSWRDLRRDTELTLANLADSGQATVVAKPHPQQPTQPDWLGQHVERANPLEDTRSLIIDCDVVVGFQSTAIFEAAACGRPVIYTAWGEVYPKVRDLLIPFEDAPELVHVARSQDELRALLVAPSTLHRPDPSALAEVIEHLGPIDGHATERVIRILRAQSSPNRPEALPWQAIARVAVGQLARPVLVAAAAASPKVRVPRLRSALAGRRRALAQEWVELRQVLTRSVGPPSRID